MNNQVMDHVVTVRGTAINVLEKGAGRPLVVVHAAGGAGLCLPYQELLAEQFRVIGPDSPGFGRSKQVDDMEGVDDLAFLYADMIDALSIPDPIVLGCSFGGWVAAELAVLLGRQISRLV